MKENPEFNSPAPIEVELNQEFYPFSKRENMAVFFPFLDDESKTKPMYTTEVFLNLPINETEFRGIKVECSLHYAYDDGLSIIPFHPDEGYVITNEDYDLHTRRDKLLRLARVPYMNLEFPQVLNITVDTLELEKAGIASIDHDTGEVQFSLENEALLKTLKCIVNANRLFFSTEYLPKELKQCYDLSEFFPVDSLPSAADSVYTGYDPDNRDDPGFASYSEISMSEGHSLRFSDSEGERKLIGVRFVLNPDLESVNPST